jgi:hypothetical protein
MRLQALFTGPRNGSPARWPVDRDVNRVLRRGMNSRAVARHPPILTGPHGSSTGFSQGRQARKEARDPRGRGVSRSYFHLHLVSDSTGETLLAVSRAATAQYVGISAIEHIYPLIRAPGHLDRVISEIESAPGIVLYTLVEQALSERLEAACRELSSPCLSILSPVLTLFQSYLGTSSSARPGA